MPEVSVPPLFRFHSEDSHRLSGLIWGIVGVGVAIIGGWLILLVAFSATSSAKQPDQTSQVQAMRVFGDYVPQSREVDWPEFEKLFSTSATSLQAQIENEAKKYPDHTFGISVRAITDSEHIGYQEDIVFTAASTTKLITAAAVLNLIDNQKLTAQDKLGDQTIDYHLQRMVNLSDNASWELLNNKVGLRDLQEYATSIGLHKFTVNGNTINAHNLAIFLQMLYRYELLSESSTKKMLGWMTQTNEQQMLPQVFADSQSVYHKYGWFGGAAHDAGIVVYNDQPFVVVIMSEGSDSYTQRKQLIRQLAQVIQQALK